METRIVKVGDGLRVLEDGAGYTLCKKGDLLVIDEIAEAGIWITKRGWHFTANSLETGLVEFVSSEEIPSGYEEVNRRPERLYVMHEADLTAESSQAGAYYVKQKFKNAPLEESQIALNACASGFFMGVRWHEERMKLPKRDRK